MRLEFTDDVADEPAPRRRGQVSPAWQHRQSKLIDRDEIPGFLEAPSVWRSVLAHRGWLVAACTATFVGAWIEKGMGLIVPGFLPSTLGELVDYSPSVVECKVMAGVWALFAMVLTVSVRSATAVLGEGVPPR